MRNSCRLLLLALCCAVASAQGYRPALPGYTYHFPQDNFNHPDYQTEWWYYTGNLRAADGHRFGFELTFFRQAVSRKPGTSPWAVDDVYMAHLALSDVSGHHYYATERLNRAGPGLAGIEAANQTIWNGNWNTTITPAVHTLRGIGEAFSFALEASPQKGPVIHGIDGVSQKATGAGHASHYISYTRMRTRGTVTLAGKAYAVDGDTWMDHEFFSESMDTDEVGWDWLSLQLNDSTELMLYRLRHKDGTVDPYSSGTYIDAAGHASHLTASEINMAPTGATWKSGATKASYPVGWTVAIPRLNLKLSVSTPLPSQEFVSRAGPSYWEGALDITGQQGATPLSGTGYLEMTGYTPGKGSTLPTTTR